MIKVFLIRGSTHEKRINKRRLLSRDWAGVYAYYEDDSVTAVILGEMKDFENNEVEHMNLDCIKKLTAKRILAKNFNIFDQGNNGRQIDYGTIDLDISAFDKSFPSLLKLSVLAIKENSLLKQESKKVLPEELKELIFPKCQEKTADQNINPRIASSKIASNKNQLHKIGMFSMTAGCGLLMAYCLLDKNNKFRIK